VDDFYLQHLEKQVLTLEFFLTRAQNAVKIGTAQVSLAKLLEKDGSFQAQEILFNPTGAAHAGYSIGRVIYKMRMRKPIEEAVKWFQQKRALRLSRDPQAQALGQAEGVVRGRSKVVTIGVGRCLNLRRPQQTAVTALRAKGL